MKRLTKMGVTAGVVVAGAGLLVAFVALQTTAPTQMTEAGVLLGTMGIALGGASKATQMVAKRRRRSRLVL